MSAFSTPKIHAVVSTILAVAIVTFAALTVDQGHVAAAPRGIVEIGALVPVDAAATAEKA